MRQDNISERQFEMMCKKPLKIDIYSSLAVSPLEMAIFFLKSKQSGDDSRIYK